MKVLNNMKYDNKTIKFDLSMKIRRDKPNESKIPIQKYQKIFMK